jgi:hypothetical protein
MLVNSLPREGWPTRSGQPFDFILDAFGTFPRYANVGLPDGTMPLFLRPPKVGGREFPLHPEHDLMWSCQLRPDNFNFAWNGHSVNIFETYKRTGEYRLYAQALPIPPGPHSDRYWGCNADELVAFNRQLVQLGEQWIQRERRRQAAGLLRPWRYDNVRMLSPTTQSDELWRCPWHPRTAGKAIDLEYPADWIGAEPVDNYNNYRQFRRIDNDHWDGPNGVSVCRNWDWHVHPTPSQPYLPPAYSSDKEAIDAYWKSQS